MSQLTPAPEGIVCPVCGLDLPPDARYCARCGARLQPVPQVGLAQVLLYFGCLVEALLAAVYGYIYANPSLLTLHSYPGTTVADLKAASLWIAVTAAATLPVQALGTWLWSRGLLAGRILLTLVCLAWALTVIGIPISLLVLVLVWRRRG